MSATKEFHHDEIEKGLRTNFTDKRDYPILFDTQMVQAILSGQKTQTTRAFKSPLCKAMERAVVIWFDGTEWRAEDSKRLLYKHSIICPYGAVGDLLWVKETMDYKGRYKADNPPKDKHSDLGWIPSIHMPKDKARIWLKITDIKAQRIQTVSEEDAREEGAGVGKIFGFSEIGQNTYREGFYAKWISIYGIESYHENSWIWAIKFKVV